MRRSRRFPGWTGVRARCFCAPLLRAFLSGAALFPVAADGADTAGAILERAREAEDTLRFWTSRKQVLSLSVLRDGRTLRTRKLLVYAKRQSRGREKTVAFVLAPESMRGTAFLQWTDPEAKSEQWLYLPRFGRSRKISASLEDQSFLGTDLSHRELGILGEFLRWEESRAPSRFLGREELDGTVCDRIERRFRAGPYRRLEAWLDVDLLVRKVALFDDDPEPRKTIRQGEFRAVGGIPTPHRIEVDDPAKSSRTLVEVEECSYGLPLEDDLFTQRSLSRGPR
ncbi:MAG: hypothetical protein KatS3mg076_0801 [Candidatus Binatia bacterium]|nr:MAG: hypothetical protein KatS3mg076_0801 [Candidatus Binatia bacterium]